MSKDLIADGTLLAATLEAENAALTALDLRRAAGLLAEKQRAVAGFASGRVLPATGAERMVRRLEALAVENKRLLERAIAAQSRVIGVIASAAAATEAPAGYGSTRGLRPAAFAVVERA